MVFRRLEVGITKEKRVTTSSEIIFKKFNLKPTLICVGYHILISVCLLVLASVFRKITSGGQNEASFGRSKATSLPTSQYTITILVDIYSIYSSSFLRLFCAAVLCFGPPNSGLLQKLSSRDFSWPSAFLTQTYTHLKC